MSKATTWTSLAGDRNWNTGGNWTSGVGADGDTLGIASALTPTSNVPTSGTFHFTIANGVTVDLANWIAGDGTIGNVTVNHSSAVVTAGGYDVNGNLTVTLGRFSLLGSLSVLGTLDVAAGGTFVCDSINQVLGATTNAGTIIVNAGGGFIFGDTVTNTGTLDMSAAGATVDFEGAGGLAGSGGTVKLGSDCACTGVLNVTNCIWTVAAGAVWTVDLAGALNVGLAPNLSLRLECVGTATLGSNLAVRAFAIVSDALLAGGGYTMTLGAGGMTWTGTGAINDQTLTLVLSASCTIAQRGTNKFVSTTVPDGITLTVGSASQYGHYTRALAGAGTVAQAAARGLVFAPSGNDTWTFTGTINCILDVVAITGVLGIANALPINTNNKNVIWYRSNSVTDTMTIGGMNLGTGSLTVYGPAGGQLFTGTLTGPLTCGTVNIGIVAALPYVGKFVMCDGVVNEIGTLAKGAGNTGTTNAITYAGTVKIGGAQTLANLTVDFAGAALIASAAAVSVNAAAATSVTHTRGRLFSSSGTNVLTADNFPALAAPMGAWRGVVDGGHNHAGSIVFHKSAPSDLTSLGVGD
jgi:hypothetical protein